MTVGDPESGAEGREQNCVKFYGTVYRQQSEIDPQQRRRRCRPGTRAVGNASAQHSGAPGQRRSTSLTRLASSRKLFSEEALRCIIYCKFGFKCSRGLTDTECLI